MPGELGWVWGMWQPQELRRKVGASGDVCGSSLGHGAAVCCTRFNTAGFWARVRSQLYQPCSATAALSLPCTHQGSFPVAGGISVGEGSPAVGTGGGCLLQAGRGAAGPLAHLSEQTQ